MHYKWLFTGVGIALLLLVLISLGEGFWGGGSGAVHWTEKLFYGICHQIPERSFYYQGYPMAVNSRCFGIFTGLMAGWVTIPFVKTYTAKARWPVWVFGFAVMLQIIDYSGNLFHVWENTNLSRAVAGSILGLSGALVISGLFKKHK